MKSIEDRIEELCELKNELIIERSKLFYNEFKEFIGNINKHTYTKYGKDSIYNYERISTNSGPGGYNSKFWLTVDGHLAVVLSEFRSNGTVEPFTFNYGEEIYIEIETFFNKYKIR